MGALATGDPCVTCRASTDKPVSLVRRYSMVPKKCVCPDSVPEQMEPLRLKIS